MPIYINQVKINMTLSSPPLSSFVCTNYLTTSYITHLKQNEQYTFGNERLVANSGTSEPESTVSSLWVNWQTIGLDALLFVATVGVTYCRAYRTTTRSPIFRFCFLPYTIFSHDRHVQIIAVTPTEEKGLYMLLPC